MPQLHIGIMRCGDIPYQADEFAFYAVVSTATDCTGPKVWLQSISPFTFLSTSWWIFIEPVDRVPCDNFLAWCGKLASCWYPWTYCAGIDWCRCRYRVRWGAPTWSVANIKRMVKILRLYFGTRPNQKVWAAVGFKFMQFIYLKWSKVSSKMRRGCSSVCSATKWPKWCAANAKRSTTARLSIKRWTGGDTRSHASPWPNAGKSTSTTKLWGRDRSLPFSPRRTWARQPNEPMTSSRPRKNSSRSTWSKMWSWRYSLVRVSVLMFAFWSPPRNSALLRTSWVSTSRRGASSLARLRTSAAKSSLKRWTINRSRRPSISFRAS